MVLILLYTCMPIPYLFALKIQYKTRLIFFIYYPVTIWLPLLMMQPLFDPISKLRWEVFVRLVEIVDHHRFKPPSGQHKSYKIGTTCICCLSTISTKHVVLMSKSKDYYPWLDKNVGFWLVNDPLVQNPC